MKDGPEGRNGRNYARVEALAEREPDDAALLLPWYAAGKLSPEDKARVEALIASDPLARAELAAIEAERDEVIALNEAVPPPPPPSLEKLMAQVSRERHRRRAGFMAWLYGAVEALSPGMRAGIVAACLAIIAAQSVALVIATRDRDAEPGFELASGEQRPSAGAALLVSFAPGAEMGAVTQALEVAGARIVDGPRPGGLYAIGLIEGTTPDAALAALEAQPDLFMLVLRSD